MNSQQSLKSLPWSNSVQLKAVGILTSRSQTAWMYCFPYVLGKVSALSLCYDGLNHSGIIKWKHQFFSTCSSRSSQAWNPADHHSKIFSSFWLKGRGKRFVFDKKLLTRTLNTPASWGLGCAERWLLLLQLLLWRTPETDFLEAIQKHKILLKNKNPCPLLWLEHSDNSCELTLGRNTQFHGESLLGLWTKTWKSCAIELLETQNLRLLWKILIVKLLKKTFLKYQCTLSIEARSIMSTTSLPKHRSTLQSSQGNQVSKQVPTCITTLQATAFTTGKAVVVWGGLPCQAQTGRNYEGHEILVYIYRHIYMYICLLERV